MRKDAPGLEDRLRAELATWATEAPVSDRPWTDAPEMVVVGPVRPRRAAVAVRSAAVVAAVGVLAVGAVLALSWRRPETRGGVVSGSIRQVAPGWTPVDYAGVRIEVPPGWRVVDTEGGDAGCEAADTLFVGVPARFGSCVPSLGKMPDPHVTLQRLGPHRPPTEVGRGEGLVVGDLEGMRYRIEDRMTGERADTIVFEQAGVVVFLHSIPEDPAVSSILKTLRRSPVVSLPTSEVRSGVTFHVLAGVPLFLRRDGDAVVAFIDRVPPFGARVRWCPSAGVFVSPAEGDAFDADGRVVAGPVVRGLDRVPAEVRADEVVIDFAALRAGPPPRAAVPPWSPARIAASCAPHVAR